LWLIRAIVTSANIGKSGGMIVRRLCLFAALALAAPLRAGTVQDDFNAAQAHLDAGRIAEARTRFAALLDRMGKSTSRSAMIVRSRLAETMVGQGDVEEAQPLLETVLRAFPAGAAATAEERASALVQLAFVLEEQGRLRDALASWQAILAEALVPPGSVGAMQARMGVARTGIWSDPRGTERMIDALLAEPATAWGKDTANATRARIGLLRLKGQLAMRENRLDDARRHLADAGKLAGGITTNRVSLDDVQLRGDLATLAWLRKDMATVVKMTAYGGATMLDDGSNSGGAGQLPSCAPGGTLAPDAMAVIEFGVTDNGRVLNARPVYASPGSGPADSHPEEEFAAAVHGWSWPADQAKATSPLWRAAIRVELRCLTAKPDLVWSTLVRDARAWFTARGLGFAATTGTDAQERQQLQARLAALDDAGGGETAAAMPLLVDLIQNVALGRSEAMALARRLDALAEAQDAPVFVRYLAQSRLKGWLPGDSTALRRLTALADQRGETRMADYLRLQQLQYSNRNGPEVEAQLETIAARQKEADPLRTQALIMLSDRAFARGAEDKAATALAATGLSPEQCTLVDVRPQSRNAVITTDDFPAQAQNWGISAYMRASHDITPAGDTTNVRVVTARPPFVFSDAVVKRTQTWKFKPVLRGTQTVGCVGRSFPVRFRM
jgi:tetratricopeptide (TPR) repeat protein